MIYLLADQKMNMLREWRMQANVPRAERPVGAERPKIRIES